MIGTAATTVMADLMETGVTMFVAPVDVCPTPPTSDGFEFALVVDARSFISSYCSVLRFCSDEL